LHLHIDNSSALGDVFEITEERFAAAALRHAETSAKLRVTFSVDGDNLEAALKSAEVLFGWNFERDRLASIAPKLKWIQIQGAGVNHLLPLDWIPANVVITNTSGAHGLRASEYLIMSTLALNSRLPGMMTAQREKRWDQKQTSSIRDKTVLIFGVGAVGGSFATEAKRFDMRVLGIRRSGEAHPDVDEMHTPDHLHALLPRADIIAVTAPHTPETQHVFGKCEFDLMKDGAGFISYSRSRLVDYAAMREQLQNDRLSAIVDVFDEEPLPSSSPLWHTPNLILTPHSSSNDPEQHAARSLDLLFENLARFLNQEPLENIVDPVLQY
jgi:phosphoglycerate dehydrogenase-like enzyme